MNDTKTYTYFHRDLSWLMFNKRVLQEAADEEVPLYERIKFMAIYASNLDEFFRVRVASLRSIIDLDKKKVNKEFDGKPKELLKDILKEVGKQLSEFGKIKRELLLPKLREQGIVLYRNEPIRAEHRLFCTHFFKCRILSYLQPILITRNKKKPPFLINNALYLALELQSDSKEGAKPHYAYINIPTDYLPRFIALPKVEGRAYYIALEDIMRENLQSIFPEHKVVGAYSIKLTRNAELNIEDEFSGNLVEKIQRQVEKRNLGHPSRFLYDARMGKEMLHLLQGVLSLKEEDMVAGGFYHNMSDLFALPNPKAPQMENEALTPLLKKGLEDHDSIFTAMDDSEYLLHFPYHSYDYVLRFFNEAAIDPYVKEIRATFYRVASNSFIINALISAAKNGKKVSVFVELKARFDEENNLKWANKMEEAGVTIIYSMPGLKVHAKAAMISRQASGRGMEYYAFLGTGNFNEKTANIYADHGLLTKASHLTRELELVFKHLIQKIKGHSFQHLLVSQFNIIPRFIALIDKEIEEAKAGRESGITVKVNNLEDKAMINKLYEASNAGVPVRLLVRGICCLVPGVKGQSEHITVHRLVDRYLEHARIFLFHHSGEEKLYMGSADWMRRNLHHRIEVVFPIEDGILKEEIKYLLELQLSDNRKGRKINRKGKNERIVGGGEDIRAQVDYYHWMKGQEDHFTV